MVRMGSDRRCPSGAQPLRVVMGRLGLAGAEVFERSKRRKSSGCCLPISESAASGKGTLLPSPFFLSLTPVKLHLENLPPSLVPQRETLTRCLEAMHAAHPLRQVILFGSHARGEARPESDVDLCLVADGAEQQYDTATTWLRAVWNLRPKPSFTLIPVTPERLREKQAIGDHFFQTILQEGVMIAAEN